MTESELVRWTREELDGWPSRRRARAVNSLSGFKSATLVGTSDLKGVFNLSVVSSVVHLGSSPAQLGMVLRPPGEDAHTHNNLLATRQCTFNHIGASWIAEAHQCSARYPASASEFEATGLTPCNVRTEQGWLAPGVEEARVRMGLTWHSELELPNGCRFVVLDLAWVEVDKNVVSQDGYLDIERAGTVAISGLDGYHQTRGLGRLSYAKVGKGVEVLEDVLKGWQD